ncbi:hypothetical protein HKX69_30015 [Streptomyces argyrophyllae]|uniref:Uncharacterized protein n=1 Tax=Streptomyces argyrophylli TaxID=2726118 RepID=A0A6M4PQ28_9ACTN|nr:hypothetical protein [Streptomyces argyrophyllae]QJS13215.1 hypothetical protein HKX69_30015 [Streptomyces argyrophyllae]
MPEITERFCRRCGQRCRRGWLRVHEQGEVKAPGANRPTDAETVYCSERCLRTSLLEAAGNMQLIVNQQREIDRLKARLRDDHQDRDWHESRTAERERLLINILDQAEPLASIDPNAKNLSPEDQERLRIAANNILRLTAPYVRRPQAG